MKSKRTRVAVGVVAIVGALVYFAISGFQEGKAYYKTIEELDASGDAGKRLRVAGIVADGSIERRGKEVSFKLEQDDLQLSVRYVGSGPVPDTFKDGVEAVVEGTWLADGSFEADHIQAKCASKYEAKYGKDATPPHEI